MDIHKACINHLVFELGLGSRVTETGYLESYFIREKWPLSGNSHVTSYVERHHCGGDEMYLLRQIVP